MADTERCRKCRYKYDNRVCRFCLDFNKYNPMTNSMKIRSMSDEELAIENLYFISECALKEGFHYTGLDGNYYKTGEDAFMANMRWLKLEVSEVEQ